jgi:hypothetical protein
MTTNRITRRQTLRIGAGLVLVTSIAVAAADSTPRQSVKASAVILATAKARTNWYTDGWSSPVVTDGETTYGVYVDPNLLPRIVSVTRGKVTDVEVEEGYTFDDDGHNELSLAVDSKGSLHILGNMHNNGLRYWVSRVPRSVEQGFDRHFDAIAGSFSYYSFFKNPKGDLFLIARAQALTEYSLPGGRGLGLYKLSPEGSWLPRGQVPPSAKGKFPVVYWSATGSKEGSYQMFKGDARFDQRGRLHLTLQVFGQKASAQNFVVYARSDDEGITWRRADGTKLALPLDMDREGAIPDIIDGRPDAKLSERSGLWVDGQDRPGVTYFLDGALWLRFHDGETWAPRIKLMDSPAWRSVSVSDRNGTMTLGLGRRLLRLSDFNHSPEIVALDANVFRFDRMAPDLDKGFTGIDWNSETGDWKLVRLEW